MTWRPHHPDYAHVHPLFWPVLWWNLHRFVARLEILMEHYGRDARISWRVSWYGVIEIYEVRPVPRPTWRHVLADCRTVVARICAEPMAVMARFLPRGQKWVGREPFASPAPQGPARQLPAFLDSS
ncbi:MAG: hypothetical protein MRY64_09150 [Hyphomonadaceae bacterium]|nr:hypothetical protein [Hyphomonadaceae bacterium]